MKKALRKPRSSQWRLLKKMVKSGESKPFSKFLILFSGMKTQFQKTGSLIWSIFDQQALRDMLSKSGFQTFRKLVLLADFQKMWSNQKQIFPKTCSKACPNYIKITITIFLILFPNFVGPVEGAGPSSFERLGNYCTMVIFSCKNVKGTNLDFRQNL